MHIGVNKKKNITFYVAFILVNLLNTTFIYTVTAEDTTEISVSPSILTVEPDETFTLDIYCEPGQPIKAFELKISFDETILQANSVTEGTIFDGFSTFFNPGTIDNSEGTIENIFNLILEIDTIINPGTLVTISFTALESTGTTPVDAYDVGVTDISGYVPITVNDGVVTVGVTNQPVLMYNENPTNQTTGISVNTDTLSIQIEDPENNGFAWTIQTSPNIGSESGINHSNGSKTCTISNLAYSTTYSWTVSARDNVSELWTNNTYFFTTEDEDTEGSGSPGDPPPSGGGDDFGGGGSEGSAPANNPPENPDTLSGPTYIEQDVDYVYSTKTTDIDGDLIRYIVDWGDGSLSDWSEYYESNVTVNMSHQWSTISNYDIMVLAQDAQGMNSSWSSPLEVIVSQSEDQNMPPVVVINTSYSEPMNLTIHVIGSNSYDVDGEIQSYYWNFGDDKYGANQDMYHTYTSPGDYVITLTVTDDDGLTDIAIMSITVYEDSLGKEKEEKAVPFFINSIILIGCIILLGSLLVIIIFRKNILDIIHSKNVTLFSDDMGKIKKIDQKIDALKETHRHTTSQEYSSYSMSSAMVNDDYDRAKKFADVELSDNQPDDDQVYHNKMGTDRKKIDRIIFKRSSK